MDLHGQIMNLPSRQIRDSRSRDMDYQLGHREARHAAAELALKADERFEAMEDLRNEVKRCFDIAQALDMFHSSKH